MLPGLESAPPNPAFQAEGYWGLRQYHRRFDAFDAAVKAHPKDANLLVR